MWMVRIYWNGTYVVTLIHPRGPQCHKPMDWNSHMETEKCWLNWIERKPLLKIFCFCWKLLWRAGQRLSLRNVDQLWYNLDIKTTFSRSLSMLQSVLLKINMILKIWKKHRDWCKHGNPHNSFLPWNAQARLWHCSWLHHRRPNLIVSAD